MVSRRPYVPDVCPKVDSNSTILANAGAYTTTVKVIVYNKDQLQFYTLDDLLNKRIVPSEQHVLWVQVTGLQDVEVIKSIGQHFSFHALSLEDTVNTHQRPKVDDYPNYQYIVGKLAAISDQGELSVQQLSLFLGHNYLVSFWEKSCNLNVDFDKSLQNKLSRLRSKECDYLLYEILDYATDSIFPVMANNNDKLDTYENQIIAEPMLQLMKDVQMFKQELRYLRQLLWANRDMLSALLRNELDLISDNTIVYVRDCYDHAIRQMDILESQRESALSLMDIYLSSMGNRLGYIMKVLTVISVIFMPPTFLVGLWGMNFKNMPMLQSTHGFLDACIIMVMTSCFSGFYFWYKGWLKERE